MQLTLEYGRSGLVVNLPDGNLRQVVSLNPATPLPDQSGAVRQGHEPVRRPADGELAAGRRDACIVICDVTRPVPNQVILPEIIAELEGAGIPSERITILIATGNHRPNEGAELVEMIGADLAAKYRVVNHHSDVDEEQAYRQSRAGLIYVDQLTSRPIC